MAISAGASKPLQSRQTQAIADSVKRARDGRIEKTQKPTVAMPTGVNGQNKIREKFMAEYNRERRWTTPSKRASGYVEERKAKVHQHGQKEGQPLSDYEAGLRSGYLQCQSDHAGLYRYKQAMDAGLSKAEAKKFSREKGTKLTDKKGGKK